MVDRSRHPRHGVRLPVAVGRAAEQVGVGVDAVTGQQGVQDVVPVGALAVPVVVEGAGGQPRVSGHVVDPQVAERVAEVPLGDQLQPGGQELGPRRGRIEAPPAGRRASPGGTRSGSDGLPTSHDRRLPGTC